MGKHETWLIVGAIGFYLYSKSRAQAANAAATTGSPDVFSYFDPLSASWAMLGSAGAF